MDMNYNINPPVSLPEICSARAGLMKAINGAAKNKAVYIRAPGGYGKTVSVMLWAESAKRPAFWHSFDEYDNTLIQFYRVWCISLLSLLPKDKNKEFSDIIYSSAFNGFPVECAVDFLTRGFFGSEKLVCVMDDFHMITDSEIKRTLPLILKRMPSNITAFFLSRGETPNQFEARGAGGKFSYIGVCDLAFSEAEIRDYFSDRRLLISESESKSIRSYTGGQAFLLNIMAENGAINKNSDEFRRLLKDYYEKSLWDCIDETGKEFLLKTAVLNKFTLELCESVTGEKNCNDMLDAMIIKNADISFYDNKYHYNRLFLEFLLSRIKDNNIDVVDVYKSVVDYYIQKNNIIETYRYAVESGDSLLIEKSAILFLQSGNVDFDKYVELAKSIDFIDMREEICDEMPAVYFSKTVLCFLTGDVRGFEYNRDKLISNLRVIADEYPQWVNFVLTYSIMDCRMGIFEYVDFLSRAASEFTDSFSMTAGRTGSLQFPFIHKGVRDLYELARTDAKAPEMPLHILGNAICGMRAGLCIEQNRLDEATERLLHDEGLVNDCESITAGFGVYIMLAETALFKGDRWKYEHYKSLAKAFYENRGAFCYRKNFLAYETRARLWDGNTKAAGEWLDNYLAKDAEFNYLYKIFQNFTSARSYIVLKESDKALSILEKIKSVAKDFDRLTDAAEADVLISLIEWVIGKKKEASERLLGVLNILYPYSYIRVVANEGRGILPVIKNIMKKTDDERKSPDHSMFRQYVRNVYVAAYEQSKQFKGLTYGWEGKPVKLSQRQTLILELLAKGRSNAEITEIMGITVNTVKSYTAIAYRKLGVNNAMDAISKARQIGLLH